MASHFGLVVSTGGNSLKTFQTFAVCYAMQMQTSDFMCQRRRRRKESMTVIQFFFFLLETIT